MANRFHGRSKRKAFGGEDARDSCEVVGDGDVGPDGIVQKRPNRGQAVTAQFEDEQSASLDVSLRLTDQIAVKLETLFATVQSKRRFVLADFDGKRTGVAPTDIRRITDHKIKRKWRVMNGWR